jgi:catechol 2,3-dioxygenase-like lactoylglutathione lyase family enzyme
MGDRKRNPRRWWRWLLLVAATGFFVSLYQSWIRIPANFAPWGDVMLDHEPGWLARMQINSLAADPAACRAALDRSRLIYRPAPERPLRGGCGLVNAVRPVRSQIRYNSAFDLTCGMMAALYWYEADLQRLAREHLGASIVRIDQLGTYSCRNINGDPQGRRSQHATANAIDIAGFRLSDGRTISVLRDWGKDTPESHFLDAARALPAATSTSSSARATTRCTRTTFISTSADSGCAGDDNCRTRYSIHVLPSQDTAMPDPAKRTTTRAALISAAPQLFVSDLPATCDFFTGKLGFTVDFVHGDPPFYGQVIRDNALIALRQVDEHVLTGLNTAMKADVDMLAASIAVDDVKQLYLEYEAAGVCFHQKPRTEPWGARTFIVADPDGNLLLFAGSSG